MTKQEFLAMSLSKGLVLQSPHGFRPNGKESTGIFRLVYLTGDLYADIENKTFPEEFIPICRPLSDLTKQIKHNGETFIPIERIGIYNPNNVDYLINQILSEFVEFSVMETLVRWHFDVVDLISKGEAIDVNTLEENPYK